MTDIPWNRKTISASYQFVCQSERGAVLIPGDNVAHIYVHNNKFWRDYTLAHHDSWYEFATEVQGHILKPEDLILVTGFLKTTKWALASIENHGKSSSVSLSVDVKDIARAYFNVERSENTESAIIQRHGPAQGSKTATPLPCDQCLFLRYYKVKRRRPFPKYLAAGAEPRDDRTFDDSGDGSECEPFS